jgi:ABC-type uncharacterized transport system permease subunit
VSGIVVLALIAGLPIAVAALGELILQRSGMINIGLEGMLLSAAFGAVVIAKSTGSATAGIAGGILGAAFAAAIYGVATITLGGDQVIAGAAVNFICAGLTGALYRHANEWLVSGVPSLSRAASIDPLTVVGWLVLPMLVFFFLGSTSTGLRMRASGENPDAIRLSGFSLARYRWAAVGCQAVLAGIAGSAISLALANGFAENMVAGRGFIALALVIFGRWTASGVVAGAALFSASVAVQYQLQATQSGVSYHLLLALPYVITIVVLAFSSAAARSPQALGRPVEE